jgi:nitrous oxidase accessory protein NosD
MEGTMKRRVGATVACAVLFGCLIGASSALASKTVCSSGCPFTSINAAIAATPEGGTVTIGSGTFAENVVVDKPLTLAGSGNATTIEPAVSNPVCEGGSLCEGTASNIILVEANNVTITKLRLEGDNPGLTSGVVVGGKDIDARNGIIENHLVGTFNGLTVSKVDVADVYLRGIYASSGGTFVFEHDTVSNVQGEEASIAMFSFESSGRMVDNDVSEANDAISSNWSKGIEFTGNKITSSGSGIHTDNNGGSGGVADKIVGNQISHCKPNGYGIFVFVPYVSATVEDNKVKGCTVGLALFGGAVSGQGPTFRSNQTDSKGASTSEGLNYGALITTDQLGFGSGDATATLTEDTIKHAGVGLFVTQESGSQATVTAHQNSIYKNSTGANGAPGTVVEAQSNWWGCSEGPSSFRCNAVQGTVAFTPWLASKP